MTKNCKKCTTVTDKDNLPSLSAEQSLHCTLTAWTTCMDFQNAILRRRINTINADKVASLSE